MPKHAESCIFETTKSLICIAISTKEGARAGLDGRAARAVQTCASRSLTQMGDASGNPAERIAKLVTNSNMEELVMFAVAVLPLMFALWAVLRCMFCCGNAGNRDGYSDLEAAPAGKARGDGPLQQLAADKKQPPWLSKMLQKTAQHVDESFVRLRAESAADHRQQLDREMARINKRLDEQDKKLDDVLRLLGGAGRQPVGAPAAVAKAAAKQPASPPPVSQSQSLPATAPVASGGSTSFKQSGGGSGSDASGSGRGPASLGEGSGDLPRGRSGGGSARRASPSSPPLGSVSFKGQRLPPPGVGGSASSRGACSGGGPSA